MIKKRQLRYASSSYGDLLTDNHQFLLSQRHALRLYRQRAIYSFIPKNACSTMRLTLAMENGVLSDTKDFNWIHENNGTFSANLESLLLAEYTFAILRCPFARLASAYLDKIVHQDVNAWVLEKVDRYQFDREELTFRQFVDLLKKPQNRMSNVHWRPQVQFLVYREYDDLFQLEKFGEAQQSLEQRLGITICDARGLTRHGLDRFEAMNDGCYADAAPHEIAQLHRGGKSPSARAMYDDEIAAAVKEMFQPDLALYRSAFGEADLLFS